MNSRASRLLVVLFLTTGLFAQVGPLRARRLALATHVSSPASEDADPVDDTNSEEGDDREEESTRDESAFGVRSSPSFRRGALVPSRLPTFPSAPAVRLVPGVGHFLAAGRELRHWIQSQLC